MAARSLNKVILIGNLTRDPELRYTPSGTPVCTFGLATNRQWVTESGEKKEDVEFHRLVAWQKLAEICGKFLIKGKKIYIEGRLQTRSWTGQDNQQRQTTEIVVEDMIMLDNMRADSSEGVSREKSIAQSGPVTPAKKSSKKLDDSKKAMDTSADDSDSQVREIVEEPIKNEEVSPDDIPF